MDMTARRASVMCFTSAVHTHPMCAETIQKRTYFKNTFKLIVSAVRVILPQIV
jgi:hypothetical protein